MHSKPGAKKKNLAWTFGNERNSLRACTCFDCWCVYWVYHIIIRKQMSLDISDCKYYTMSNLCSDTYIVNNIGAYDRDQGNLCIAPSSEGLDGPLDCGWPPNWQNHLAVGMWNGSLKFSGYSLATSHWNWGKQNVKKNGFRLRRQREFGCFTHSAHGEVVKN